MGEIGVVLPAFNAGRTVGAVVAGVKRYLPQVTVVDDGSTDATRERAADAGARVLFHPRNRGKGAALRTAFEALHSMPWDALITLDADGQHDPSDIPRFLEAFERRRPDLIVGSRQAGFTGMSRSRRFGNRFSSAALAFFSGLNLPDSQSGYRLYSMPFIQSLRFRGNFYEAEMESLLQAAVRGLRVETVPVHLVVADGRKGSHYRPWLDTFRICLCVVQFSLRRRLPGRAG